MRKSLGRSAAIELCPEIGFSWSSGSGGLAFTAAKNMESFSKRLWSTSVLPFFLLGKMCKFTNRLFVFALLLLAFGKSLAHPVGGKIRPGNSRNVVSDLLEVLYDDYSENGFQREDILYDQRQKGAENFQLKLDGVVIGMAPQMGSNWLYTMAEYYLSEYCQKDGQIPL